MPRILVEQHREWRTASSRKEFQVQTTTAKRWPVLTGKSQLLSMAEALSRLIPNADCRVILVIRHRQVSSPCQNQLGDYPVNQAVAPLAADAPIPGICYYFSRYGHTWSKQSKSNQGYLRSCGRKDFIFLCVVLVLEYSDKYLFHPHFNDVKK